MIVELEFGKKLKWESVLAAELHCFLFGGSRDQIILKDNFKIKDVIWLYRTA